uniref:Biogenesis of lysosomal organelles complex 1 subunit 4 n=1 Tax=Podarcis muralis TaxID=64176 RepID=A0A670JA97_PODMU
EVLVDEEDNVAEGDACGAELLLTSAAADYAGYLLPSPLGGVAPTRVTRVDEFVGMLDMIRSDSSQVVSESVPHIHAKAMEMKQLYRKIDKLEAFVKMVGNSVSGMEEQITKAESDLGTFPNTFKKILHTVNVPSFLNKTSSSRQNQTPRLPAEEHGSPHRPHSAAQNHLFPVAKPAWLTCFASQ